MKATELIHHMPQPLLLCVTMPLGITELLLDREAVYHCHVHKLPPPLLDLNKFHLHKEPYTNQIRKGPNFRVNFFTQPKEFLFLQGRFQQNSAPSSLYLKKLSKWCDLCKLLEPCLTHSNPLFHTDFPKFHDVPFCSISR
jgi:hypothetical protein